MKLLLICLWLIVAVKATPCIDNQHCASCSTNNLCTSQCYNGYYGLKCNHKCKTGCRFNICHSETGIGRCTFGCKLGFYGTRCNIPCETHNTCRKCPHECERGFCQLESSCAQGCQDSYYGTACRSCPAGCKVCNGVSGTCDVCHHCEGNCTHGCKEGCKAGYFGDFCEHTCSTGCLSKCNQISGECFKCKFGFSGGTCKNQCPTGCRGEECELDGTCTNGCREGSYGQKCTLGCAQGWYGPMCEYKCGKGCQGEICDRNGICSNGCKVNFYGERCLNKCPAFCLNKVCEAEDGSCISCEKGFYGSHCDKSCGKCVDDACTQKTGHCTQGCLSNHRGEFCQHDCKGNCDGEECREVCKIEYGKDTPSIGVLISKYIPYPVAAVVVIVSALVTYAAYRYKSRRQSVVNGGRTGGQGNQLQPQRNPTEEANEPTVSFYCEVDNDPMRSPQLPRRCKTKVLLDEFSEPSQTLSKRRQEGKSNNPISLSSNNYEHKDDSTIHIEEGTSDSSESLSPSVVEQHNDACAHIQEGMSNSPEPNPTLQAGNNNEANVQSVDIQADRVKAVLHPPSGQKIYLTPFASTVEEVHVNEVVNIDFPNVLAEDSGYDTRPQGEVNMGTSTRPLRGCLPITNVYDPASEFDDKDTAASQNDFDAVTPVHVKAERPLMNDELKGDCFTGSKGTANVFHTSTYHTTEALEDGEIDEELTTIIVPVIADCYDNFHVDDEEEAAPNTPPKTYSKLFTINYVRK